MITIETLKNYGADTEEGLNRCMGKEDFYLRLVGMVIGDDKISELTAAVNNKDFEAGFQIAHNLKGMYGNLSMTPIYKPMCEITELLRSNTDTDYSALLSEITEQKARLDALAAD